MWGPRLEARRIKARNSSVMNLRKGKLGLKSFLHLFRWNKSKFFLSWGGKGSKGFLKKLLLNLWPDISGPRAAYSSCLNNFVLLGRNSNGFEHLFTSTSENLSFPFCQPSSCTLKVPNDSHKRTKIVSRYYFWCKTI